MTSLVLFCSYMKNGKKYEYDASIKNRNFNIIPYKSIDSICPEGYVWVKPHKRMLITVQGYCRKRGV